MTTTLFVALVIAYFFGSFPSGYLAAKIAGVDIREQGSGNIGATNVLRVLGKKYGYAVFFCDAFKGFLAVRIALWLAHRSPAVAVHADWVGILAALTCVLGHTFPVWLKFKGGKGVATSAGTMLGITPVATLIAVVIWVVVFETSRYVSVASVVAAICLPSAVGIFWLYGWWGSGVIFYSAIVIAIVVCWRHRSNFSRLLHGTEQRFPRKQ